MDKLKKYINGLSREEQDQFAALCGTTIGYLRRAMSGGVQFEPERCADIEKASGGAVTRKDLRPNDWHRIWLELTEPKQEA